MSSEMETRIRQLISEAQVALEGARKYPNPYVGIPSPLEVSLLNVQGWLKEALSITVTYDIAGERGDMKFGNTQFAERRSEAPNYDD